MIPNFSVIIPHHNNLETIDKLLNSISTDESIEIILIDDRSEKNIQKKLEEKVKKYKNLVLIKNETNGKGAGCARNLGLKAAKGKWLVFADADDFFLGGAFEIMSKYKNSSAEIIYFLVDSIFLDTNKKSDRHWEHNQFVEDYFNKKKNSKEILCLNRVPWGKMIKKSHIDKYNIKFEEVSSSNDAVFSIKSNFLAGKIEVYLEKIYCVTRRTGSITTTTTEKNFDSIFSQDILIDKFLQEIKKDKFRLSFFREIILSYKFGIKKVFETIKIIKENNLKIFTFDLYRRLYPKDLYKYLQRKLSQKKYLKQEIN